MHAKNETSQVLMTTAGARCGEQGWKIPHLILPKKLHPANTKRKGEGEGTNHNGTTRKSSELWSYGARENFREAVASDALSSSRAGQGLLLMSAYGETGGKIGCEPFCGTPSGE